MEGVVRDNLFRKKNSAFEIIQHQSRSCPPECMWYFKSIFWKQHRQWERAQACIERALQVSPQSAHFSNLKRGILAKSSERANARPIANRQDAPGRLLEEESHLLVALAAILHNSNRVRDSMALLSKTLKNNKNHKKATFDLAMAHFEMGHFKAAISHFESIQVNYATCRDYLRTLLACLMKTRQFMQAQDIVLKLIRLHPKNVEHKILYGEILLRRKEFAIANRYLTNLERAHPADAKILCLLGKSHLMLKRLKSAKLCYLKSISKDPRSLDAYLGLGKIYQKSKREKLALQKFSRILDFDSGNYKAHYELGATHLAFRNFPKAETHLRQSIRLNPKNERAYMKLIQLFQAQGDAERVESVFDDLIGQFPSSVSWVLCKQKFLRNVPKKNIFEFFKISNFKSEISRYQKFRIGDFGGGISQEVAAMKSRVESCEVGSLKKNVLSLILSNGCKQMLGIARGELEISESDMKRIQKVLKQTKYNFFQVEKKNVSSFYSEGKL